MQQTPLYSHHQQLQAKMVDFAGWQMPIQYTSIIEEHLAVREKAGIFDVSHMGVVEVKGAKAFAFLQKILANDVAKLKMPGSALYSVMLNEAGGVIDDLIVYFIAPHYYRLVINAGCCEKDMRWLAQQAIAFDISVELNHEVAMIALQGPASHTILSAAFPELIPLPIKSFSFLIKHDWFIASTGYTGELGFEIILPAKEAATLWERLMQQGARPIGLGARDTLRLEAGLNLYGHEMDENTSAWEANLAWTLALNDRNFIGKAALLQQQATGIQNQLLGIVLREGGVLRASQVIETTKGEGVITSGTFSPSLKMAIGMARVPMACDPKVMVRIRDKKLLAECVTLPFVRKGQKILGV